MAIEKEEAVDFLKERKNQVKQTSEKLRLSYPQKIELQACFPEDKSLYDV